MPLPDDRPEPDDAWLDDDGPQDAERYAHLTSEPRTAREPGERLL